RVEMNCGVWRYHPTRKVFEVVCQGTTNPFGLDYDQYGELFITNCVIKHLFHVIPGAHYDRMYGKDIYPYSYELMHSIADYIHWDGGVYVSDWCDTGECHNFDKVDASTGRIHKVTYGTPKAWKGDVSKLSDVDLIKLQTHTNDWFARHARRVLQERGLAGKLDPRT